MSRRNRKKKNVDDYYLFLLILIDTVRRIILKTRQSCFYGVQYRFVNLQYGMFISGLYSYNGLRLCRFHANARNFKIYFYFYFFPLYGTQIRVKYTDQFDEIINTSDIYIFVFFFYYKVIISYFTRTDFYDFKKIIINRKWLEDRKKKIAK